MEERSEVRIVRSGVDVKQWLREGPPSVSVALVVIASMICIALAAIRLYQGHGLVDAVLSGVTLAVAALPEEFPVVFSFFLGVGVYRLARRQALVRRAVAVESIGAVTCICSDKTGTMTEGRLALSHPLPVAGVGSEQLVRSAAMAARSDSGDPLDAALLAVDAPADAHAVRLATFPFTEDRRRETAVVRLADGSAAAVVKGAPETVFSMCSLDAADLAAVRAQVDAYASTGHKVVACATQPVDEATWQNIEPDRRYALLGLLAFEDTVRDGCARRCKPARQQGYASSW